MVSLRSFLIVWTVVIVGIAAMAAGTASPLMAAGLLVAGVIGWTLFEYCMHRWVFHWQPTAKPLAALVFVVHGNHHDVPNDRLRNLMPVLASLPIGAVLWLLFQAIGGPAANWAFLGFVLGYVGYDLTHYACHQWPMRSRIGRRLKRHHMQHHHMQLRGNFAISAIFWDRVFNTRIALAEVSPVVPARCQQSSIGPASVEQICDHA